MIEVGIKRDKALNALPDFAVRLYFFVLPHTDNFGRYEGDAELVRAGCMPLSKRPIKKFESTIIEICESGLWTRYKKATGKLVIQYNEESFDRINKFLIKNRENPEYPPYEEGDELIGRPLVEDPSARLPLSKIQQEEKKYFGDYVQLTDKEHLRLVTEYGQKLITEAIEYLNLYFEEKPKKLNEYSSHNAVLRRWGIQAAKEKMEREQKNGFYRPQKLMQKKKCQWCHDEFDIKNIETHERDQCALRPPPASQEFVDKTVNEFHKTYGGESSEEVRRIIKEDLT
jgi:hypothetical protein